MLLRSRYKGRENDEEDVSSHKITLKNYKILEIERRSTRSQSVEKSL
jgi:hypothetical protein